jgi:hypothetical protein
VRLHRSPYFPATDEEGAAGGSAALVTGDAMDEEVIDTEWFFLVLMTQSFVNGGGLAGQSFFSSSPVWVTSTPTNGHPGKILSQNEKF